MKQAAGETSSAREHEAAAVEDEAAAEEDKTTADEMKQRSKEGLEDEGATKEFKQQPRN